MSTATCRRVVRQTTAGEYDGDLTSRTQQGKTLGASAPGCETSSVQAPAAPAPDFQHAASPHEGEVEEACPQRWLRHRQAEHEPAKDREAEAESLSLRSCDAQALDRAVPTAVLDAPCAKSGADRPATGDHDPQQDAADGARSKGGPGREHRNDLPNGTDGRLGGSGPRRSSCWLLTGRRWRRRQWRCWNRHLAGELLDRAERVACGHEAGQHVPHVRSTDRICPARRD